MSSDYYTADVHATAQALVPEREQTSVDDVTAVQLARIERALDAIDWKQVPTVSAATAAAFAALLRAAHDRDCSQTVGRRRPYDCPICGCGQRDLGDTIRVHGGTWRFASCADCGYPSLVDTGLGGDA